MQNYGDLVLWTDYNNSTKGDLAIHADGVKMPLYQQSKSRCFDSHHCKNLRVFDYLTKSLHVKSCLFCKTCRLPKDVGDCTGLLVRQCLAMQWSGKMPSKVWVPGGSGGPGGPGRQYTLTILPSPTQISVSPTPPSSSLQCVPTEEEGEGFCT